MGRPRPPTVCTRSWKACSAPTPHAAGSSSNGRQPGGDHERQGEEPAPADDLVGELADDPGRQQRHRPDHRGRWRRASCAPRTRVDVDAAGGRPLRARRPAARNSNPARVLASTQAITTSDSGNSHTIDRLSEQHRTEQRDPPDPGTGQTPNGSIDGGLSYTVR